MVTDLRVEGRLLEGLVRAGSRPPVGGPFIVPSVAFCIIVSPNGSIVLALNVSQLFAPIHVRLRLMMPSEALAAPHIKVSILAPSSACTDCTSVQDFMAGHDDGASLR